LQLVIAKHCRYMKSLLPLLACLSLLSLPTLAQDVASGAGIGVDQYNLSWNVPGPNSAASMPLGNGDIGLNAWVDPTETCFSIFRRQMPGAARRTQRLTPG